MLERHPKKGNRSQQLESVDIPAEILGWNWGAFWLGPLWSWGNQVRGRLFWWMVLVVGSLPTWLALGFLDEAGLLSEEWGTVSAIVSLFLAFSHFVFYPIAVLILGFRGNQSAWRHNDWHSVAEFKRVQRRWAIAGWILGIPITVLNLLVVGVLLSLFGTDYIAPYAR